MERLRDPGTVLARTALPLEPGKGIVTIGKPSGAEPIFLDPGPLADHRDEVDAGGSTVREGDKAFPGEPGDWEMRVRPGDVLSRIVRVHYGRVSRDLEQRLAKYNKISNPDKLVVGQVIYLPNEERLLKETL